MSTAERQRKRSRSLSHVIVKPQFATLVDEMNRRLEKPMTPNRHHQRSKQKQPKSYMSHHTSDVIPQTRSKTFNSFIDENSVEHGRIQEEEKGAPRLEKESFDEYLKKLKGEKEFSLKLTHCFDKVRNQADRGNVLLNRVTKTMKRFVEAEMKYADELKRISDHELSQLTSWKEPDRMTSVWAAYLQLVRQMSALGSAHSLAAAQIRNDIMEPLDHNRQLAEDQSKDIVERERTMRDAVVTLKENLEKSKTRVEKHLVASDMKDDIHVKPPKMKEIFGNKFRRMSRKGNSSKKMRSLYKSLTALDAHNDEVAKANQFLNTYVTREIPQALGDIQNLEERRIRHMRNGFQSYCDCLIQTAQRTIEVASEIGGFVHEMSIKNDIHGFIQHCAQSESTDRLSAFLEYEFSDDIGTRINEQLRKGELDESLNLFYGSSIPEIMKAQKKVAPDLDAPRILLYLIRKITELGGQHTEGLFRISASHDELTLLGQMLERNDYTFEMKDAHLPAAMMKKWLRDMGEPLFTFELYEECLRLGKNKDIDEYELDELLNTMPPENVVVLKYVVRLAREVVDNEEETRMTLQNIAIIFGPCLLRPRVKSERDFFINAQSETRFMDHILRNLSVTDIEDIDEEEDLVSTLKLEGSLGGTLNEGLSQFAEEYLIEEGDEFDVDDDLPPGWSIYYDDDGYPFYYNEITGVSQWDFPEE